jgi:hypothetical protein
MVFWTTLYGRKLCSFLMHDALQPGYYAAAGDIIECTSDEVYSVLMCTRCKGNVIGTPAAKLWRQNEPVRVGTVRDKRFIPAHAEFAPLIAPAAGDMLAAPVPMFSPLHISAVWQLLVENEMGCRGWIDVDLATYASHDVGSRYPAIV